MKNIGWKTISGALLVGLGYAVQGFAASDSEYAPLQSLADALFAVGYPLAGFGVAHKLARVEKSCGR